MKKVLYFDCFAGISGDMTLGALLDLGIDKEEFLKEMEKINVDGFKIEFGRAEKNGIGALDVNVILENEGHEHHHGHNHHHEHDTHHVHNEHKHEEGHAHIHSHEEGQCCGRHKNHEHGHMSGLGELFKAQNHMDHEHGQPHMHEGHCGHHGAGHHHKGHVLSSLIDENTVPAEHKHEEGHAHHSHGEGQCCGSHANHDHAHHGEHVHRNVFDVNNIIDESSISENAKALAKRIFMKVAEAEAKVHGKSVDEVHFHEVGALDSIVDIIGTAILIDMIKPDEIYSSVVNDGFGFINCQHGQIPVPVPATAEIFAAANVVSRQIDVDTELVTPTGAAIIAELATGYGSAPAMKMLKTGYGSGKKNISIPNVLRVVLGERHDQ